MTVKTYETGGQGRKNCPDCELFVGVSTKECECGHSFDSKINVPTIQKRPTSSLRSVAVPAGACPVKLSDSKFATVCNWCERVQEAGEKQGSLYTLQALKYYAQHFFQGDQLESIKSSIDAWDAGETIQEEEYEDVEDDPLYCEDDPTVKTCPDCETEVSVHDSYCLCGHDFDDDYDDDDYHLTYADDDGMINHGIGFHTLFDGGSRSGSTYRHTPRTSNLEERYRDRTEDDDEYLVEDKKLDAQVILISGEPTKPKKKDSWQTGGYSSHGS